VLLVHKEKLVRLALSDRKVKQVLRVQLDRKAKLVQQAIKVHKVM